MRGIGQVINACFSILSIIYTNFLDIYIYRLVEKNTDAILDSTDKNKKKQEEVDETVNNCKYNAYLYYKNIILNGCV